MSFNRIIQKPKICKGCDKPKMLFSHGYCKSCWGRLHPVQLKRTELKRSPLKRKIKPVIQDGRDLTQKEAFALAYSRWEGKWFLTGERVPIEKLTASNFAHCLSKKQFKWFKYYWRNIILLTEQQHFIYDNGSKGDKIRRVGNFPKERWERLYELVEELKAEYAIWIKTNPKTYKI